MKRLKGNYQNKYERYGCKNREEYIKTLSVEYSMEEQLVWQIARNLGEQKDFSDLIIALEEFQVT